MFRLHQTTSSHGEHKQFMQRSHEPLKNAVSNGRIYLYAKLLCIPHVAYSYIVHCEIHFIDGPQIRKRFGPSGSRKEVQKTLSERIHACINDSLHNQFYRITDGASVQAHLDLVVLLWPKRVAHKDHPDYLYWMEWFRSAWAVLETYVPFKIRHLGMARVPTPMLEDIYRAVDIKPCTIDSDFPLWYEGSFSERQKFCLKHGLVLVGSPLREWWIITGSKRVAEQVQYHTKFLESLCLRFGLPEAETIGCLAAGLENTVFLHQMPTPQAMSRINELQTWAQNNPQQWQSLVEEFQYLIRLPRVQ